MEVGRDRLGESLEEEETTREDPKSLEKLSLIINLLSQEVLHDIHRKIIKTKTNMESKHIDGQD